MSIIRLDRPSRNKFTTFSNAAFEIEDLSWKAKGIWAYLMSRPDNWKPSVAHLTKNFPGGKFMVYGAFEELKRVGLCTMQIVRNQDGTIQGTEYIIHEIPLKECLPHSGFPHAGKPSADKQTLIKTDVKQRLKVKKDIGRAGKNPPPPPVSTSLKIQRKETVWTSKEEHEKLLALHGEEKTDALYQILHEWKIDKPKSKWRKWDYGSVKRWVEGAYEKQNKSEDSPKEKPEWLKKKEVRIKIAKRFAETYKPYWELSADEKDLLFSTSTGMAHKFSLSSDDFEEILKKKDADYGYKAFGAPKID